MFFVSQVASCVAAAEDVIKTPAYIFTAINPRVASSLNQHGKVASRCFACESIILAPSHPHWHLRHVLVGALNRAFVKSGVLLSVSFKGFFFPVCIHQERISSPVPHKLPLSDRIIHGLTTASTELQAEIPINGMLGPDC